jgi:hypothetical protein
MFSDPTSLEVRGRWTARGRRIELGAEESKWQDGSRIERPEEVIVLFVASNRPLDDQGYPTWYERIGP